MKNVIIDSSSAILLFRCNIFLHFLDYCIPVIPESVLREITLKGYSGADFFTELAGKGIIKVCKPEPEQVSKIKKRMHSGESEAISLFYEGKGDFVIIDDGKGGVFCRDNSIPYINALLTVKILFFKQLVSEQEYYSAWNWLVSNGRYSRYVLSWADDADESKLAFFI